MDIFTTQLTRVVPVPIKPAKLKVKALLKEAASSGLSEDLNHLENHEYYFTFEDEKSDSSKQESSKAEQTAGDVETLKSESDHQESSAQSNEENTIKDKHLDLYA